MAIRIVADSSAQSGLYSSALAQQQTGAPGQFVQAGVPTFLGVVEQESSITNKIISVDIQEKPLLEALRQVSSELDLNISYSKEVLPLDKKVSLQLTNVTANRAIYAMLEGTGLRYAISGNKQLIIFKKETPELTLSLIQADDISGTVTDASSGETLPGVNILVKGTSTGASTDAEGNFELTVESLQDTLVVSFVGYQTQEVPIQGRTEIDVTLQPQAITGEEMVVVGYGMQKKVNVIGSINTISDQEISDSPVSNVSNALAGRIPGLIVQQRSGEPGFNNADLLVRGKATLGNNTPLIVVDGIQGRNLNSLNPSDIENISVLKDASAAIYGARAANGVILVTTKSGNSDTPPLFNYNFYEGLKSPTKLPEMASSYQYSQMIREVQSYRGIDESNMTFSEEDIEKYRSGEYPWTHPNTDWYEQALADFSRIGSHNFSVSGGASNINYFTSFGITNEDGIYENSGTSNKKINLRVRIDWKINEYINLGLNISGYKQDRISSIRSSDNVFTSVIRNYPYRHAVFPETNKPGPDIEYGDQPIVTPSLEPGFDDEVRLRSNNKLSASFKIPGIKNFEINASYAFDKYIRKRKTFEKPYTLYSFDEEAYMAAGNTGVESGEDFLIPYRSGTVAEPQLTDYYDDSNNSSLTVKAEYQKSINSSHNIGAFIAFENNKYEGQGISAFRRYFNSDQLPYLFAGGDPQKDNSGWAEVDARVNFISRIDYNYKQRYLLQFGFRRDGSLRFSEEGGRWGNFPSILAGWRVSQHEWWKDNLGFIEDFKLKASWAKMGNDLIAPFQYLSSYEFGQGIVVGADLAYSPALYQSSFPNPGITWETAKIYNVGFESSLFNHKVNLNMDLFYERRDDILIKRNASVPEFTGITLPDENFGIVDNRGVEIELGYRGQVSDLSYEINSNFNFARNKVIEFDEPERTVPWQVRTGLPQGAHLLYKSEGIFRDEAHVESLPHVPGARPGDIIIKDVDGDGEITNDDRKLIPLTRDPEITFSSILNLNYKNIGLSFLVQGVENAIRNVYTDERQGTAGNYYKYDAIGRWTPNNTDASKPRAFEKNEEYWRESYLTDYGFHDLGYARLKNVRLSYTMPNSFMSTFGVKQAQIYLTGQNLLLLYNKNPISDPEVTDAQTYPVMRTFSIGANIVF